MTFSMSHKTIWLISGGMAFLGLLVGFAGPIPGALLMGAIGAGAALKLYGKAKDEHARHIEEAIVDAHHDRAPRVHVAEVADGESIRLSVDWKKQMDEINEAWTAGDYEFARTWLQKFAYKITEEKAPEWVHSEYKRLMAAFTRDDPLYANVMSVAFPAIAQNPGIIQSQLAKQFPQFDTEQFRYAMYYGEVIGDVCREKRGRSYALSLPA